MIWQIQQRTIDLADRGHIMGILNVTPDSFSDGGSFVDVGSAVARALEMESLGATIIDIGGESTRPGAQPVGEADELARVLPVIRKLRHASSVLISIDTMKPAVAAAAVAEGVEIINDVSGFRDPEMRSVAARTGAGCVVMHMQGEPRTMQHQPIYNDVVSEVRGFFEQAIASMIHDGVKLEQIVLDPGIGFGKQLEHNQALLRSLSSLTVQDRPLLLGVSRKSFLSKVLDDPSLASRSWPTVALTSYAREQGVRIHRVHEVLPNVQALRMTEAILASAHTG